MSIDFKGRSLLASEEYLRLSAAMSEAAVRLSRVRADLTNAAPAERPAFRQARDAIQAEIDALSEQRSALGENPEYSGAAIVAKLCNLVIELLVSVEQDREILMLRPFSVLIDPGPSYLALIVKQEQSRFLQMILIQLEGLAHPASYLVVGIIKQSLQLMQDLLVDNSRGWESHLSGGPLGPLVFLARQQAKAELVTGRLRDAVQEQQVILDLGRVCCDEAGVDLSLHLEQDFPNGFPFPIEAV